MATSSGQTWAVEAKRLARTDLGAQPWVHEIIRQVDSAEDDDLGTMLVAWAVPSKASAEREAELQRERAQQAARREEEDRRAQERRREEVRQERAARVNRHRDADEAILGWGFGLSVTLLVPWLLGRYLLRDSFLLPTATSAPSEVRNFLRAEVGGYFLADYLTGLCALAFLVGVLGVVRPWRGRVLRVIVSAAILVGSWYAHGFAIERWETQEPLVDAQKIYPFPESNPGYSPPWNDTKYFTCGRSSVIELDGSNYYTWTATVDGTDLDYDQCNRVYAYGDWDELRSGEFRRLQPTEDYASGAYFTGSGEVCDTDGSPEGLLWHGDDGTYEYFFSLLGSGDVVFETVDEFQQSHPNCQE